MSLIGKSGGTENVFGLPVRRDDGTTVERREHLRYAVPAHELYVVGCRSRVIGQLRNIGKGGLKISYVPESLAGQFLIEPWAKIDILSTAHHQLVLPKLHCKVIYDMKELSEDASYTGENIRVCGLMLMELTGEQHERLNRLLASLSPA
jgi:hypothetical protein